MAKNWEMGKSLGLKGGLFVTSRKTKRCKAEVPNQQGESHSHTTIPVVLLFVVSLSIVPLSARL